MVGLCMDMCVAIVCFFFWGGGMRVDMCVDLCVHRHVSSHVHE